MKMNWNAEELVQHFTLQADEHEFLGLNDPHNQLGKAILLKCYQYEAHFPQVRSNIPDAIIEFIAHQLYVSPDAFLDYQWDGRRMREHRQLIRDWLGFRRANIKDQRAVANWLLNEVLPDEYRHTYLRETTYKRLREQQLEAPSEDQIERLVNSAIHRYQRAFFEETYRKLPQQSRIELRNLLSEASNWTEQTRGYAPLHELKLGAGSASVKHIQRVCNRLKYLQGIELPEELFADIPLKYLRQYQRQMAVESPSHLLRREESNPEQMYSLLAAFCWVRQREVTDDLVDLFIRVLKDIKLKAESKEKKRLLNDFIRVDGKQRLLFNLAEAMIENPDGVIKEVLYPIVGQARLEALVEEAKHTGTYQRAVQTRIGGSYSYHYRRMLPPLLEVLEFRSNNERHRPLINALKVVQTYLEEEYRTFYPMDAIIPMNDVIPPAMASWVCQPNRSGTLQIRRTRYELCVLQALREQLRSKEIWVIGADRHRNPDEDTPADYREKRVEYYRALDLPLDPDDFIKHIQEEMTAALKLFHDGLDNNAFCLGCPIWQNWCKETGETTGVG